MARKTKVIDLVITGGTFDVIPNIGNAKVDRIILDVQSGGQGMSDAEWTNELLSMVWFTKGFTRVKWYEAIVANAMTHKAATATIFFSYDLVRDTDVEIEAAPDDVIEFIYNPFVWVAGMSAKLVIFYDDAAVSELDSVQALYRQ